MKQLTYSQLQEFVATLTEHVPFELVMRTADDGSHEGYVPYILNDSIECYLVLEQCRIVGTPIENYHGMTEVRFADHTTGCSVQQGDNIYTLWFTGARMYLNLYRYHEIGHFWAQGQEQWRRLVYIIGTIYDKEKYAPEPCCTPEEVELARLIEFAPFRVWSPVNQSILPLYPETAQGALAFASIADEVGDKHFARVARRYAKHQNPLLSIYLSHRLIKEKSLPIYQAIMTRVIAASSVYPSRDYGEKQNAKIQSIRDQVTQDIHKEGFTGTYPLFRRDGMEVLATEEHPFTIMESDDYRFRIQFMVSEYTENAKPAKGINRGFFQKRGNRSYIYRIK